VVAREEKSSEKEVPIQKGKVWENGFSQKGETHGPVEEKVSEMKRGARQRSVKEEGGYRVGGKAPTGFRYLWKKEEKKQLRIDEKRKQQRGRGSPQPKKCWGKNSFGSSPFFGKRGEHSNSGNRKE